jgi:hypothetical protein
MAAVRAALATALLAALGCGINWNDPGSVPPEMFTPAPTPPPTTGQARLAGRAVDENGLGVAGAHVQVAETGAATDTDANGAYALPVLADSTVTLAASAPGMADTYRDSVLVAADAAVQGFDLMLLSPDEIAQMNALGAAALGGGDQVDAGVVAIRLHGDGAGCAPDGAHLSLWPPRAAAVTYSRPSGGAGLDQPDPSVDGVQPGAAVGAWLLAAAPPGNMMAIGVDLPGCRVAPAPPPADGLTFSGARHVVAGALTVSDLFLEATP